MQLQRKLGLRVLHVKSNGVQSNLKVGCVFYETCSTQAHVFSCLLPSSRVVEPLGNSLTGGSESLKVVPELLQVCLTPICSLLLIPTRHGVKNSRFHAPCTVEPSATMVDCVPSNCKPISILLPLSRCSSSAWTPVKDAEGIGSGRDHWVT